MLDGRPIHTEYLLTYLFYLCCEFFGDPDTGEYAAHTT